MTQPFVSHAVLTCCAAFCLGCGSSKQLGTASQTADSAPPPISADNTKVEFFTAGKLAQIADELSRGSATARTIATHPNLSFVVARRVTDGVPEVHRDWADLTFVQAGHASVLTGGHTDGTHITARGEYRGGTIVGGTSRPIGPGDLFLIPAGVPHQYRVERGDSLRYLTVKVAQTQR